MSDVNIRIRCQRCGADMELRDPKPGMPWTPDQFWVCNTCGRHFWTTYPPPKTEAPAAPAPAPAAPAPKAV
jgi:DNA-directed RNA polymerase subunit RPC12/RpoP